MEVESISPIFSDILPFEETQGIQTKKKDSDEKTVRKAIFKEWIKILEWYARPGVSIPSTREMYEELAQKGVDAAVHALEKKHWYIVSWMVREKIEGEVRQELSDFDLNTFLEKVAFAQRDPSILQSLRDEIRHRVLK